MVKTLTDAQIKAKARKKKRLAALKKRTDKVIDRSTRTEFAKYYTPRNRLLDVIEVAKLLGVTKRRVRSFINTGRLPAVKLNKLYLIKFSDFMLFKEKPRISGAPRESIFDTPEAEKTDKPKH
jgi:excisionase family DNA binding protein